MSYSEIPHNPGSIDHERKITSESILRRIVESAEQNHSEVLIFLFGSGVYNPGNNHDLDTIIIADKSTIKRRGPKAVMQDLGIELDSLSESDEKDRDDLLNNLVLSLHYQKVIDGIPTEFELFTVESFLEVLTTQPRNKGLIIRRREDSRRIPEIVNFNGELTQRTDYKDIDHHENYDDVTYTGIRIDSTGIPILPYIWNQVLTGETVYDNLGSNLVTRFIREDVWTIITRAILYYKGLYDEEGKIKPEAFTNARSLICKVLRRCERFSEFYLDYLEARFVQELLTQQLQERQPVKKTADGLLIIDS